MENAWQIDDASGAGGSRAEYIAHLNAAQQSAALTAGWSYTVTCRMVLHRGSFAQSMLYSLGGNRFNVFFDLDANNDLYARIGLPGSFLPVPLVTNNSALARSYHDHQLVYDPATEVATYFFDGVAKFTWSGDFISSTPAGRVLWGSGSSGGMDVANYHRAVFEIDGTNVVSYEAGTAGNPAIAPDPGSQGWTLATVHAGVLKNPVSPDSGAPRPAWQLADTGTFNGSTFGYLKELSPSQQTEAATSGWRYRITSRLADDLDGTLTMVFLYGDGTRRYGVFWDFDAAGNLVVTPLGGSGITALTANANVYHTHELVYFPGDQTATYYLDGVAITNWPGQVHAASAGEVVWGAGASAGKGVMNFHDVEFVIGESNLVASYDAGRGTPPDPTTRGWTFYQDTTFTPGLAALLADERYFAETLPEIDVGDTSAVLNGRANPDVQTTYAYFEWGKTTNYGNATPVEILSGNGNDQLVSHALSGLTMGLRYHYRLVASNRWGIKAGDNEQFAVGPAFETVPIAGLPGVEDGSMVWGDYDNDGRLDFILTGVERNNNTRYAQIWRNTGDGFANVTAAVAPGLPGVADGEAAWGDYDNDGRLDFVITGMRFVAPTNFHLVAQIWRNTGSGFQDVTSTVAPGLPAVRWSDVAWGDYDSDGRLDLLIMGFGTAITNSVLQIWRNTPDGFTNVTSEVAGDFPPGMWVGDAAWGDYDNDGRLDLLLTGYTPGQSWATHIWRNTSNGFTNVTSEVAPGLPQLHESAVAWGDYDGDGWLDFAVTGDTNTSVVTSISQIWRNTGNGFTNVTETVAPGLRGSRVGAVAWGDHDNDGRLDLLLGGQNASLQVLRNNGTGFDFIQFEGLATGIDFVLPLIDGAVGWGDYDNDGRLDILYAGYTGAGRISGLLRNRTPALNTLPTRPTGLAMTASESSVMLSWNAATDTQTPSSALSYNVRAGTSPGGTDLVAFHSAAGGFRRVPAMGNTQLRRTLPITGLTNGQTVYWSVQAIDGALAGGPFSVQTSVVSLPELSIHGADATNAEISWTPPTWDWTLEETEDPASGSWTTSPSGGMNPVGVPLTNSGRFYRLGRH